MPPALPLRIVRPDGTTAAEGPILADLLTDVARATGRPWMGLAAEGWRIVSPVSPAEHPQEDRP